MANVFDLMSVFFDNLFPPCRFLIVEEKAVLVEQKFTGAALGSNFVWVMVRRVLETISKNGRLLRNLVFWAFFVGSWTAATSRSGAYPLGWYYMFIGIHFGLYAGLTYINNLWLAPRYLSTRKYGRYMAWAVLFVITTGAAYTLSMKLAHHYFPLMKLGEISFILSELSDELSFASLFENATYYSVPVIWLAFFNMAWYVNDYGRQRRLFEEASRKQVETELSFLKNQLNPHFLFNTLNNLYGLALKKSDKAPDAILKLSLILRYLLYESNVPQVSFEKEKEIMQAYIDLEMLRLAKKHGFQFAIEADGAYDVPPLLWLPVLENMFTHGTRIIADTYIMDYKYQIKDNRLLMTSRNSYRKKTADSGMKKEGGIGLDNLKKRLSLLYPGRHTISTEEQEDVFVTEVHIPLA